MKDTYQHKGMRRKLVAELRESGITNSSVLVAIESLPRHFFMDNAFLEWAYENKAFPIGNDQTISQPYTVAYQTSLLEVQNRDKILEIGTGSGYQAAILALLGARVYTVERQELLHQKAKALLGKLGFGSIRCYYRDGTKGLPEFSPFDKILVTAGAIDIPNALKEQLRIGGVLVIPVGEKVQKMMRITRLSKDEYREEILGSFRFVPFLKGVNARN